MRAFGFVVIAATCGLALGGGCSDDNGGGGADTVGNPDVATDEGGTPDPGPSDEGGADPGEADPGTPDPGTADPGGDDPGAMDTPEPVVTAHCIGMSRCLFAACAGESGDALTACVAAADCGEPDTEDQGTAAGTLLACMDTNACPFDVTDPMHYRCMDANCFTELVACSDPAEMTAQGGCCPDARGCADQATCRDFLTAEVIDWSCVGRCTSKSSQGETEKFWRVELCIQWVCYDASTTGAELTFTEKNECERLNPSIDECNERFEVCSSLLCDRQ